MLVKVEFEKSEHAESVAKHLYRVQRENNYLVFEDTEFDKEAFDLAAALEGVEGWEYDIRSDKDDFVRQNFNLSTRANRQTVRTSDRFTYIVKIEFLSSHHCFTLLADEPPRFLAHSNGSKEVSLTFAVNIVFAEFLGGLFLLGESPQAEILTELFLIDHSLQNDPDTLSEISGKIEKATLTIKNIGTRNVIHFLTMSCEGHSPLIQFFAKNVTIERVS